jgi:hypothetical protein
VNQQPLTKIEDRLKNRSVSRLSLALLLGLAALLGSCDEVIIYQDYPVVFDDPFGEDLIVGDPAIFPGTNHEQLFEELLDGDDCYIIYGFQGGIWVHLSIRVTGLPSSGTIFASLGTSIGEIEYDLKLMRTAEGFLEAYDIPIPINVDEETIEALYGTEANLTIRYTTELGEIEAVRKVILGEG